jgi:hypothetical protein
MNKLVNDFNKTGYVYLKSERTKDSLISLKKEIASFYTKKNINKITITVGEIDDFNLQKKIIELFNSNTIRNFLKNLSEELKTEVYILPTFHVMKNYHINRTSTERIGWHRDCSGEQNYSYTRDKLKNSKYVFGKIGIYLQENLESYGGAIDIIPYSHKYIKKNSIFLRKLQNLRLYLLTILQKRFKKFYNFFPESLWMKFLSAKKTKASLGSPVFFDSRIQHRGSPIDDKYVNKTKKIDDYNILVPDDYTKISIYAHFGSTIGADSYFYDRVRRESVSMKNLSSDWLKEISICEISFPQIYVGMQKIISPIFDKYFTKKNNSHNENLN